MVNSRSIRENPKLATSFGAAALFGAILVGLLIFWRDGIAVLGALLGAALGRAVGILLAPYEEEEKRFKALSKGIAGFLTGYVVGKIDPVFQLLVEKTGGQPLILNPRLVRTLLMSLACFMVTTIWVFVARIYWQGYE